MRYFLYILIFFPLLVTSLTFAWVWKGEQNLKKSLNVPMPPIGESTASQDPLVQKGQAIFNTKGCVYCHGPNGAGEVPNNNSMGGKIPSLTKVSQGYSDEELKAKILGGVRDISQQDPSGPTPPLYMPSWKGKLTDEELEALVAFLKSLAPAGEKKGEEDF